MKTEEGKLGAFETWILTLQAKNDEVSYQKIRLTVRKDKPLPLKEEDFSVSDRPMRTIYYLPTYVQVGDKLVPAKIKMVDEVNKGTQSVLTISERLRREAGRQVLPEDLPRERAIGAAQNESHTNTARNGRDRSWRARPSPAQRGRPTGRRPRAIAARELPRSGPRPVRRGHVRQPRDRHPGQQCLQGGAGPERIPQVRPGQGRRLLHGQGRPHIGLGVALGRERAPHPARRAITSRPISRATSRSSRSRLSTSA